MVLSLACAIGLFACGSGYNPSANPTLAAGTATYDVKSYGALGNGFADDSNAILRAIGAAVAAGRGTVHFPCGDFVADTVSPRTPGQRSVLYVSGANSVALIGEGACSHIVTHQPQRSLIEFNGGSKISVSKLRLTAVNAIYQERYGFGGGSAVRLSNVRGGSVTQLEIDGAAAGAIYLTGGTTNVEVSGNSIHDTYGAGIWEDDCGGANSANCLPSLPPSNNVYESNTLVDTTQAQLAAIDLDDGNGSANAMVRNNTISWTHGPLASNPQVHCIQVNNASDATVSGNTCKNTPWDAIVITTGVTGFSKNVAIQNNTMTSSGLASNGGSGIVVYDDVRGLGISAFTIAYNIITTAADDGIRVYAASKPGNIHDGTIANNTIHNSDQRKKGTRYGIDIERSVNVQARDNTITGDGTCIAVGINAVGTGSTATAFASNTILSILGVPIDVH